MSIYIEGVEMPTSPVLFCIHPDGKVFADLEGNWREYMAVPVPAHGRLIDADALVESFDPSDFWNPNAEDNCFAAIHVVNCAPTIILAKEEGHA